MPKRTAKDKKIQKEIALRRIRRLFTLAEKQALTDRIHLADRYVFLARKISMHYLVPIPTEWKRRFCKHCYRYLLPHTTCRVRVHRGKIIVHCYNCNRYMRIPLNKQ